MCSLLTEVLQEIHSWAEAYVLTYYKAFLSPLLPFSSSEIRDPISF